MNVKQRLIVFLLRLKLKTRTLKVNICTLAALTVFMWCIITLQLHFLDRSTHKEHYSFKQLVQNKKIIGDISWMLDIAIIGFPKCGTTTISRYLNTDEVFVYEPEICALQRKQTEIVVQKFNKKTGLYKPSNMKWGIKCPSNIDNTTSLELYQTYFPRANFIIGVRHPIRWFESYYNYIVTVSRKQIKTPPINLFGPSFWKKRQCDFHPWFFCNLSKLSKALFHVQLSKLGKTPMSAEETKLMMPTYDYRIIPTKAKIFLYDLEQLSDQNETRTNEFRRDLSNFLGIKKSLPPMIQVKPEQKQRKAKKKQIEAWSIDICDDEHSTIRELLLEQGRNASYWIRNYFLKSEDVVVSSKYFFEQVLRGWEDDPCDGQ